MTKLERIVEELLDLHPFISIYNYEPYVGELHIDGIFSEHELVRLAHKILEVLDGTD